MRDLLDFETRCAQGNRLLLASTALPRFAFAEDTPKKGGRLTVAADSEPRNLNPAIVASNGVFFLSSKIVEPLAEASFDGEGGLGRAARHPGRDRPTG